jgi:transposase
MNIQVANVLSDVSGMTGQAIVKAIFGTGSLSASGAPKLEASKEGIAHSLEGNWPEDLLFVLKQEQDSYEFA